MPLSLPDIKNVGEILIIFREGGRGGWGGYPLAENSAKIINLIFFARFQDLKKLENLAPWLVMRGCLELFTCIFRLF